MDQTVDVAIVGGGLSGLAAGRALTRAGSRSSSSRPVTALADASSSRSVARHLTIYLCLSTICLA
jgi:2-polyprenyl-6-methoxyphenol hydroxylase-like FAD-dependent oxidoreductase